MAKHPSDEMTLDNVDEVLRYHPASPDQARRHEDLADAAEVLITSILHNCPASRDRDAAIQQVRIAKMLASASIALENDSE